MREHLLALLHSGEAGYYSNMNHRIKCTMYVLNKGNVHTKIYSRYVGCSEWSTDGNVLPISGLNER